MFYSQGHAYPTDDPFDLSYTQEDLNLFAQLVMIPYPTAGEWPLNVLTVFNGSLITSYTDYVYLNSHINSITIVL